MAHVVVIGGGLAGCLVAKKLADRGAEVAILEKSENIGGKVKNYGCKATDKCNNCGLCLVGDLWENIDSNSKIEILTNAKLIDIYGSKGNYSVMVKVGNSTEILNEIESIVVSIGFNNFSLLSSSCLEFDTSNNIITGSDLEKVISCRGTSELFGELYAKNPESIAFIQCFGSRDIKEKAMYCSRICCAYSTRAAKVIKQYYPETIISFFYMDLQWVENKEYFNSMKNENIEFIECRPVKINSGNPAKIIYEDPKTCKLIERDYELIVLSEGIHPANDVEHIAEICMLEQDENGFLKYVKSPETTGVYIAGCAGGPKRIEEVYAQSLAI
ncbi:MAG TPA: FAD-dependent oxidoreductase, partial [Clostridiales bacterium]|nr:FAD-dependent oxidoreductase [Clostridiales bacterium]